ncbi:MAK10-like protein [Tanacetum coccineum]
MENPEQAFVEYASSRTDKAGGKWYNFNPEQNNFGDTYNPSWKSHPNLRWKQPQNSQNNFSNPPNRFQPNGPNRSFNNNPQKFNSQSNLEGLVSNFIASHDARLSKFEAEFKRQQSKATNKIDTVLKAITERIAKALPSDTVKNPKLNVNPTTSVLSARSYPTKDPQCSNHTHGSLHFNQCRKLRTRQNGSAFVQGKVSAKMKNPRLFTLPCRLGDSKPFDTLADLGSCMNIIPLYIFKKLNIGLLEETDHVFGLADGTKSYPVGIVKDVEVHIGKLKLLNDFYVIDMKKDPETPLLVGRGFLATANAVKYKVANIEVGEGITRESYKPRPSSDGVGTQIPYYARKDFLDYLLPIEWEIARDAEINPSKDVLMLKVNGNKPLKNGDGAWHAKIRLIDPDREEFTKTLQSIPTTRKLSERENTREIIDLDHFYDT